MFRATRIKRFGAAIPMITRRNNSRQAEQLATIEPVEQIRSRFQRVPLGLAILMVALSVMSYFDRTIMSLAGPLIIKEFSISETEMGSVFSAFLLSYSVLMVPGGHLADRFGPRWVLTGMGLGSALFTGLTALGGRPGLGSLLGVIPSFLIIRFGMGLFTAPLYPALARMNANWVSSEKRARVWGFVSAGAGIGGTISPLIFPPMIALIGWRLSFWVAAVATLALALIWRFSVRDQPDLHSSSDRSLSTQGVMEKTSSLRTWGRLLGNRNLVMLTMSYMAVGYFQHIFWYWMYYYFGEVRHFSTAQSASYTSSLFLAWAVSAPLGGWVADRLACAYGRKSARRWVSLATLASSAVLLYVSTGLNSPLAVGTAVALAMGCSLACDAVFWAVGMDLGGKQVGAATAIMNSCGNLGGVISTVLTPFVASQFGWTIALHFGSLIMLIGALMWVFLDPTRPGSEDGGTPVKIG